MKIKSYVKEALARIQGDNAEALAQRNYRFVTSALELKISEEKHASNKLKREVEKAKEELETVKYPKVEITSEDSYLRNLKDAQNSVTLAESAVTQNEENVKFLQKTLDEYNSDVEEVTKD